MKTILFTLIIPGTVIGIAPSLLFFYLRLLIKLGGFRYLGILFLVIGFMLYLISVIAFLSQGKGTPMIYFMEKTQKIFGKEPMNLVNTLIYKFSRNPMYLGVIVFIFGLGILLESGSILIWSGLVFVIFHFVVIILEEPHLREKYGEAYRHYSKKTPRWFSIRIFSSQNT